MLVPGVEHLEDGEDNTLTTLKRLSLTGISLLQCCTSTHDEARTADLLCVSSNSISDKVKYTGLSTTCVHVFVCVCACVRACVCVCVCVCVTYI